MTPPAGPQGHTHSPTPWTYFARLSPSENHRGYKLVDADSWFVADISPRDEDGIGGKFNCELIVAAVNASAHAAALVSLAERVAKQPCAEIHGGHCSMLPVEPCVSCQARTALAATEAPK